MLSIKAYKKIVVGGEGAFSDSKEITSSLYRRSIFLRHENLTENHSGDLAGPTERIPQAIREDDVRVLIPKITFTDKSLF